MDIDHTASVARLTRFFESLTSQSVAAMADLYTTNAYFKDPFNEVRGAQAIAHIFSRMFEQVDTPRFEITATVVQQNQAFVAWDFHFQFRRRRAIEQHIRGATHLRLSADGRIAYQRDYWDAAEEFYEKLPVLGGLMRLLRHAARRHARV